MTYGPPPRPLTATTPLANWRLIRAIVIGGVLALLAAGLFATLHSERLFARQTEQDARVQAQITAASIAAALDFNDAVTVQENVMALGANPRVVAAGVYRAGGGLVAGYRRGDERLPEKPGIAGGRDVIEIVEPVRSGGRVLGAVYMRTAIEPIERRLTRYVGFAALAFMGALGAIVVGLAYAALRRVNTELERRAERLAESEARHRAYWDNTDEALFAVTVDPDGQFRFEGLNPSHERMTGLSSADVAGKSIREAVGAEIGVEVEANYARCVATGAPIAYPETLTLPAGRRNWETVLAPVRDTTGRIVRLIGSSRDVTERRLAEDALRQNQKMESIGQLTGGIAHDLNNLLTPIMGTLDLLRRRIDDERNARLLGGAMQSAERARALVQRLLTFARRQDLKPQAVSIEALVDGLTDLITRSLGPQVSVRTDIPAGLPAARIDPNQLELAILNLCVNARDAMPEGGSVVISAREEQVDAAGGALKPGHYLRLAVRDNGVGMDAETLKRAVEPFFSTKGLGKGTGLGLAMVHGLAEQSGGTFRLASAPGDGTTAELWLPVSADAAVASFAQRPETLRQAPRAATVLLVDDEEIVRSGTAELLKDLGYTVVEANSGGQALDQVRAGLSPDVVVTDHMMPGMTGADLAVELRRLRPGLPVLLVSGYANLTAAQSQGLVRLAKPFRLSDLAGRVAELLEPA